MAKLSLTANTPVILYKSVNGVWQNPTRLEFRIDDTADESTVIRYATTASGEVKTNQQGDVTNAEITSGDVIGWDDWMPLLLNEIKTDDQMKTGDAYAVVSTTDVDVYFAVTGSR